MSKREPLVAVFIAALALITGMAVLQQPTDFWLTADQQGDKLLAKGDFAEAVAVYEDPLRQGVALFRGGDFESAAAAFARVDEPESAFDRGNALIMLGKYDDAIASYDRALQFEPDWKEAIENRAIAVARRDKLKTPDDDSGGTGGKLKADEIVFDDRAQNASQTQEIEVGKGDKLSDDELRELWLQRVQTKPGDFLRAKFSYQLARRDSNKQDSANP